MERQDRFPNIEKSLIIFSQDGQIFAANNEAAKTRGYSLDELHNLNLRDLKAKDSFEEEMKELNLKRKIVFETSHKRKDGVIFPVRVEAGLYDDLIYSTTEDISKEKREQEELRKSIETASRTQRGLLPKELENNHLIVKNIYEPINHVSGDFFNYIWDNNRENLSGFLVDVSGHGLATAIHTSTINTIIREEMRIISSPSEIIKNTNEKIQEYFPDDTFAAMMYFNFDFKKKILTYCSGGINYLLSSTDKNTGLIIAPGSLVGVNKHSDYTENVISLKSGDAFYFVTDGFTDLIDKSAKIHEIEDFEKTFSRIEKISEKKRDDVSAVCVNIK